MEAAAGILWRPNTPGMLSSVAAVPCNIAFLGLQGIFFTSCSFAWHCVSVHARSSTCNLLPLPVHAHTSWYHHP